MRIKINKFKMGDNMDKINLEDKETLEKLKDYLDNPDMTDEDLLKVIESLTEDQKEEILEIIAEDDEDFDDDDDDDDDLIGSAKKGVNTSLAPIKRKDMMKLSDLNNEEIVEQFQLGNQNALAALVEKNQGPVRSRASYFFRSHGNDLDLEDLVQSGMLGMIRAAEKFDLSLGYKFTTYAYKWIDKAIRKAINKEGHTIRIPAGKYLKLNKLKQILKANPEASDEELYRILENEGINKKQADDLFLINRNQVNSTSLNINLDSEDSTGDELMDMVGDESTPVDMLILEKTWKTS